MGQNGNHLFASHAGEPAQKIVHARTLFEILEQRPHRNARSLEHPRAADALGHAFDRGALSPLKHGASVNLFDAAGAIRFFAGRWLSRYRRLSPAVLARRAGPPTGRSELLNRRRQAADFGKDDFLNFFHAGYA